MLRNNRCGKDHSGRVAFQLVVVYTTLANPSPPPFPHMILRISEPVPGKETDHLLCTTFPQSMGSRDLRFSFGVGFDRTGNLPPPAGKKPKRTHVTSPTACSEIGYVLNPMGVAQRKSQAENRPDAVSFHKVANSSVFQAGFRSRRNRMGRTRGS